jgi:hypothetical protein
VKRYIWLFAVLLFSGCSALNGGGIQQVAQHETILYEDLLLPNPEAEELLEKAFSSSTVPWDDKELFTIISSSRNAIEAMGIYLKSKIELDGSLPYYEYKSSFNFVNNQYNILQKALDKRIETEGAISREGNAIYYYVKRDILTRLAVQQSKIAMTEKGIDDKASKNTIEEMKRIFRAVKPLIDMAL